jgi:predicted O-methyltransferase YrrM
LNPDLWTAVDHFISDHFAPADDVLSAALSDSEAAGLPAIQVTANQGKFLHLLAQLSGARRVLEFGTLGGYSTIWLARALPADGRLITLEYDPQHAAVAARNIARAGLSDRVEIRVGPALDTLPKLDAEAQPPFDLIFIDADKTNTAAYFDWAVRLARPGSVIVVDNVVRKGAVIEPHTADASAQGVRRFYESARRDPRVDLTALQTVGAKGYDGFALARVI